MRFERNGRERQGTLRNAGAAERESRFPFRARARNPGLAESEVTSYRVFWLVMTIVAVALSATYGCLSLWGGRFGIGSDRLRAIRRSSWGLFAWAAICAAHYAIGTR